MVTPRRRSRSPVRRSLRTWVATCSISSFEAGNRVRNPGCAISDRFRGKIGGSGSAGDLGVKIVEHIEWKDGGLVLLDQRRLPREEVFIRYETVDAVADAITDMVVRGAPAIGVTAAYGAALGAQGLAERRPEDFRKGFEEVLDRLAATRPTAVNLFWAIERMKGIAAVHKGDARLDALDREAALVYEEDLATNRAMGRNGAVLVPDGARVLTHCNTGSLATAGYGTALGVIRAAVEAGKRVAVFADETRPYLQGSRLTAWECVKEGIDVTILADSAAGHVISRGGIDLAIVGADRIAANGDTANKIGTYT
ncbi:MAG: S-methyl-5-thioribose-1-phosphate isomerase, partial [Myxococcales bacterium]|nr:S-methyl-5-thioribose-1-phosphate isomerase [Myxococcales bacterium]